jgi:hypothetical protein
MKKASTISTSEYPVNGSPYTIDVAYSIPMMISGSRTRWKKETKGISFTVIVAPCHQNCTVAMNETPFAL